MHMSDKIWKYFMLAGVVTSPVVIAITVLKKDFLRMLIAVVLMAVFLESWKAQL